MLKYAIFDLDGTLTDSMYIWHWLAEAYFQKKGLIPQEELTKGMDSMSLPEVAACLIRIYGLSQTPEEICQEFQDMVYEEYAQRVQLKEGVAEALKLFHQQGVKMGIATASLQKPVQAALSRLGVWELFQCCCTCDQAGAGKESPAVFTLCQKQLGASSPQEAVVFEDSLYAARTAKKSGFWVAGVWDSSSAKKEPQMRQLCDYYFSTASEWRTLL